MKHIKLFENSNKIKKVEPINIRYFDLYPMLEGLEPERPGIKERIKNHIKDDDVQFAPINSRILGMNLFYYGVGDEYPIKSLDTDDIEHSKKIHPKAFVKGTKEEALRLDLNLIWSTYDVEGDEVEEFYFMPKW